MSKEVGSKSEKHITPNTRHVAPSENESNHGENTQLLDKSFNQLRCEPPDRAAYFQNADCKAAYKPDPVNSCHLWRRHL